MKFDKQSLALYAVTDRRWLGEESLLSAVEAALQGGATMIQLREKTATRAEFLALAIEMQALCKQYDVPLIINDDVEIAIAANADGVHVGQSDMQAGAVRERLGDDKIIGVSAQTLEMAQRAEARGADYLGVGAMFPTGSKENVREVSYETLSEICRSVSIPVVGIGGISLENVAELAGSGVAGVAVISAIFAEKEITAATKTLRRTVDAMLSK